MTSSESFIPKSAASDQDLLARPAVRWTVVAVFALIATVGALGNSIVVCAIASSRRLRSIPGNVFVTILAISDLWLCIFCAPVQLHYQLTDRWAFGPILCRVVFGTFAVPIYISALCILWIAVDRHRLIVCPLKRRWTPSVALVIVVLSVLLSALVATPVVYYTVLYSIDDDQNDIHLAFCLERWPTAVARRAYTVLTFALQFCLPLATTVILYAHIHFRLRARRRRLLRVQPYNELFLEQQQQHGVLGFSSLTASLGKKTKKGKQNGAHRRGRRTSRILIAIVAGFVVCWSPWSVLSLIVELDRSTVAGNNFELIDVVLKIFALTGSACVNPVFYCWLNDNFRSELFGSTIAVRLKVFAPTAAGTEIRRSTRGDRKRSGQPETEVVADGIGRRQATALITNVATRNETRAAIVGSVGMSTSEQQYMPGGNTVPRLLVYRASLIDVEQERQAVDQTLTDSVIFDRSTLTRCDQLSWCCPADDAEVDNVTADLTPTGLDELQLPPQHHARLRRFSMRR